MNPQDETEPYSTGLPTVTLLVHDSCAVEYMLGLYKTIKGEGMDCRLATHPLELLMGAHKEQPAAYLLAVTDVFNSELPVVVHALRSYGSAYIAMRVSDPEDRQYDRIASAVDLQIPAYFEPAAAAALFTSRLRQWLQGVPGSNQERYLKWICPTHEIYDRQQGCPGPEFPYSRIHPRCFEEIRPPAPAPALNSMGWVLCCSGWVLKSPKGHAISLSASERQILVWFSQSEDGFIPLHECSPLLSEGPPMNKRSLAVVISRLRAKCSALGLAVPIFTQRGKGYQFAQPLTVDAPSS